MIHEGTKTCKVCGTTDDLARCDQCGKWVCGKHGSFMIKWVLIIPIPRMVCERCRNLRQSRAGP